MKKSLFLLPMLLLLTFSMCGCGSIGDKNASLTIIYVSTAVLSLLLLAFCFISVRGKEPWFLLLFSCVFVVNVGYLTLAISDNISQALFANRLAYLGSVFLPLSMLMIIIKVTNTAHGRWFPYLIIGIGAVIFMIAASYPYLDVYYKNVQFNRTNGVTVLDKEYGPLHASYLIYLLVSFSATVFVIIRATLKKTVASPAYAGVLAVAVFVNIGVWLTEQLVQFDFEMLSISYIISECFILGLRLFMTDVERQKQALLASSRAHPSSLPASESDANDPEAAVRARAVFVAGIGALTPKEREIFDCYVSGMNTDRIKQQLSITENTLKFHNKNIYGKLGVNSRKQLVEAYKSINEKNAES